MKFKELFSNMMKEATGHSVYGNTQMTSTSKDGRTASNLGTTKFRMTLNKENIKTPNFRIDKVLQMLEDRPFIKSQINQLSLFLISDISVLSDDEKTKQFYDDWFSMRPNSKTELEKFVSIWTAAGTAYLEPVYAKVKGGKKYLDNIFNVADPSLIYENVYTVDPEEHWLLQVPFDVRSFDGKTAKFYPVNYIRGSYLQRNFIWAIPYPKEKYIKFTLGWSRVPWYGSGLLTAAVDDFDTEESILKNWALRAKYRALGKKIIGFYSENGEPIDMTEIDGIKDDLMSLEEEDNLLVNRKFVSEDLSFTNTDDDMMAQVEHIRKDIGGGLTPNYMTAFSQDSSLATAAEAKVPFSLTLKSMQESLKVFLNDLIIKSLSDAFDYLDTETTEINLGKPELYSRDDVFNWAAQLYNNRACTFNEYRVAGGFEPVEGGDSWGEAIPLDKKSETQVEKPLVEKLNKDKKYKIFRETYLKEISLKTPYIKNKTATFFEVKKENKPKNPFIESVSKKTEDVSFTKAVKKALGKK